MLAVVRHEDFYGTGSKIDESLGVYVGWTTRSKSSCNGMPVCNERGDIDLIFSGEEYPEPGVVGRLRECGHSVDGKGLSYLVHVYEDDQDFPRSLNGMFHGVVTNRTLGTATLFNDRFGMHRLYYHESPDTFYFASEAKAILAVRDDLRETDPQGLGEFVSLGCVLENRTLFRGIRVLPGGSAWVFRDGSLQERHTYFRPREWEEQSALDPESYYRELRDVLSRNLPRYFNGGEPIGMTLTGGLDTRVIMAWQKHAPRSLPCYTFGGTVRDCRDVVLARQVASLCKQSHEVIQVGDNFLKRFPHYAERSVYLTEGGVDVYRASDLYVSEKAREIAPVKIVGTYGSEIVRHDVMFKPASLLPGLFTSEFDTYTAQARSTYARVRRDHPVTFAAFRQSPWYHHGILSLERTQLTVRSPYLDNDFVRTVFRAPQASNKSADVRLRLIGDGNPALGQIRSDRGVGGQPGISSTVARNLLEFTFKAEYAYDYGMPQWLAKIDNTLAPLHLERLFLGRHKFSHYRLWYRDSLAEYVRQILLDPQTLSRPYIDRRGVEAVVEGHTTGTRNYTTEIHKLLTLELLQRSFFDVSSIHRHHSPQPA
jgi:asparagine synthase (glutamine-hydrolysing)